MPVLSLAPRQIEVSVLLYSTTASETLAAAPSTTTINIAPTITPGSPLTSLSNAQATTTPDQSSPAKYDDGLSPAQIGAVIASIVGFVLLVSLLWCFCSPKRRRRNNDGDEDKRGPVGKTGKKAHVGGNTAITKSGDEFVFTRPRPKGFKIGGGRRPHQHWTRTRSKPYQTDERR